MPVPSSVDHAVAKRCLLAAVIVVAVLLVQASSVTASGPEGTLKGFVTDSGTSVAIAGATVTIKATDFPWVVQATTDASGFYTVPLPNGNYAVSVSSPSYYLGSATVDVGSGLAIWSNVTLTAAAPRSAHLRGYVTDSVSSAAVTKGQIVAAPPFWVSGNVYTNASALNATGFYAMDLVPNTYVASTDGIQNYTPYTSSYLYLGAGQTRWLNFSLTPDPLVAWINGTVVDANNYTLLAGASITATVDGLRIPPTTSNATGSFSLRVPTGDVAITADASGHAPGAATVYVFWAGTFTTTLYLAPLSATVRGTVRNGLTGGPVPGALVVASPFWSSGYFDEAMADASGSYRLNLTADDFDLRATAQGFTSWYSYAFLSTGETDWVNVTLWPLVATVQGYVVDAMTGTHLAGVYVNAYDPRAGYSTWAVADASGLFSVLLPPSPAIMLRVTGVSPYIGAAVYLSSRPFAITWANITLDRVAASVRVTVTDEPTGLPLASASVSASWGIGSGSGVTDASGVANVGVPGGMDLYVYVGAVGHFAWSGTVAAFTGTYDLAVQLNPALTANVTVQGYVRDAVTNATITFATVQATGYDGSGPGDYTDGTGYYSFAMVPAPQAIRVAAYGYAAAAVSVAPAPGSTIWVNVSLARDTTVPVILSFTATPSTNLGPANPTTLRAAVNETSFDRATLSIWMLRSTAGTVGTFLNLGALWSSRVSVAPTTPGNVSVSAAWDTRTSVARLTDGIASEWWPATASGYPFLIALSGSWDNATLAAPTAGTAYFDARTGTLLYVYTTYGYITGQDQPGSTFQPYTFGMQVDLGTASLVGPSLVMGSTYQLGALRLSVSPAVPGGTYAALLETWDAGGNYARSAVLLQAVADTTPPVARAGVDQTVDQGATVTLDGAASSDDTGIASYTWTFADGTLQVLYGATATHIFANPGVYLVTLTVQDASGNVGTDTLTVTVRDTAPPTVSISAPTAGANVSGSIIITASASDNVAVVRVEFLVDGSPIGTATAAPFQFSLDTHVLANGNHTIEAVAYDAAGNLASFNRTVSVSNAPGSGGGPPGFLGIDPLLLVLLAVVFAAIGVGIALIAARRRRPRAPTAVPPAGMVPQAPSSEGTPQGGFESRNP